MLALSSRLMGSAVVAAFAPVLGRDATITGGSVGGLRFANCIAPVVVERVYDVNGPAGIGVSIDNCAAVHLRRSVFTGGVGIEAQFTDLVVSECVAIGSAGAAAVVANSRCESLRTFYTGWSQPGVRLQQSVARFANDGSSSIGVAGATAPVAAIEAIDCQLQLDPATLACCRRTAPRACRASAARTSSTTCRR